MIRVAHILRSALVYPHLVLNARARSLTNQGQLQHQTDFLKLHAGELLAHR